MTTPAFSIYICLLGLVFICWLGLWLYLRYLVLRLFWLLYLNISLSLLRLNLNFISNIIIFHLVLPMWCLCNLLWRKININTALSLLNNLVLRWIRCDCILMRIRWYCMDYLAILLSSHNWLRWIGSLLVLLCRLIQGRMRISSWLIYLTSWRNIRSSLIHLCILL